MEISGTITKLNKELKYGFLRVPKLGDVFFSEESKLQDDLNINRLIVGQKLKVEVVETERGLFAKSVSSSYPVQQNRRPEASL